VVGNFKANYQFSTEELFGRGSGGRGLWVAPKRTRGPFIIKKSHAKIVIPIKVSVYLGLSIAEFFLVLINNGPLFTLTQPSIATQQSRNFQRNNHATLQRNNNATLQRKNHETLQRNNHVTLQPKLVTQQSELQYCC
jgi:hypothetical protein